MKTTKDTELNALVRQAYRKFAAMVAAYSLGVFNDNFFKQAMMMLAVAAGLEHMQGWATIVFTLPFILFAAPAGWMADRFCKRNIIVGAKGLEVTAMIIGAAGIYLLNWPLIFIMLFVMALQSTIFSPALNGTIPELFPKKQVFIANSRLRVVITTAIVLGIAVPGFLLVQEQSRASTMPSGTTVEVTQSVEGLVQPIGEEKESAESPGSQSFPKGSKRKISQFGRTLVAMAIIGVALVGLLVSLGVPRFPAANPNMPFPKAGPVDTVRKLFSLRRDPILLTIIIADTMLWFVAMLQVQVINVLGYNQLNLSPAGTGGLNVSLLVGVAIGGLLAARLSKGNRWHRVLVPATLGMAVCMLLLCCVALLPELVMTPATYILLVCIGIPGGIFLVPCESFIQIRPAPKEKGTVWATANFTAFSGMLLAGPVFNLFDAFELLPTTCYAIMAFIMLGTGIWLAGRLPRTGHQCVCFFNGIVCKLINRALRLRYRIIIKGEEEILSKGSTGILLLPNHPALIDPIVLFTSIYHEFQPRPLADRAQIEFPFVRWCARRIRTLSIPDIGIVGSSGREEIVVALEEVSQRIQEGENFLVYPAGGILRGKREELGAKSGVEVIVNNAPDARVVLVRTKGLWGSALSWASGKKPFFHSIYLKGALSLLASGLFFMPRREVVIEMVEAHDFPKDGSRDEINRYLEAFHNEAATPNTYVPYTFWESGGTRFMPEPPLVRVLGDASNVSSVIRHRVEDYIREASGISNVNHEDQLGHDLGLDSLGQAELIVWIEQEFGHRVTDSEALHTVGDVLLAADGSLLSGGPSAWTPVPAVWFKKKEKNIRLSVGEGTTILDVFLQMAQRNPDRVIVADQISGARTYRDLITAVLVLKPRIKQLSGKYVGIMLPAGVGATVVYMATLFAGKIPVMINWTLGERNISHSMNLLEIKNILTAKALIHRLKIGGLDFSGMEDAFVFMEEIRQSISLPTKLLAVLRSRLSWKNLRRCNVPETAVVLFTSGSETRPKAVPLTHQNILTNVRDIVQRLIAYENDRILGMLPPFHSFGLVITTVLPLCINLPVVYHTNPTEGAILARLVDAYQVSIIAGTPTFLNGIVSAAAEGQLNGLRLAFTAAEKCPEHVYHILNRRCPGMKVLEGYGITECSPAVSINDENNPKQGSIGIVLPSLEYAIVDVDSGHRVPSGKAGMLLVRGPSIFHGYLHHDGESPFVKFEKKQWYRTGDLVQEDENGVLTFCGRLKRFVKLGGEMISLPAVEEVLNQQFAVETDDGPSLAVETTSDLLRPELVLFTVRDIPRNQANQAIRKAGLSALHHIRRVVVLESIPVLGTGKTNYRTLKSQLEK